MIYEFLLGQQLSPKKLQWGHNKNTIYRKIQLHRVHPMCNIFLKNLCFASCPQCATVRKNFNSKMTKMNRNELIMVFKMIKLTSKTVSHHLYQNILPLFTKNWPMFFKMCNNVPNVQHFFGEFRCGTLGAPGVYQNFRRLLR